MLLGEIWPALESGSEFLMVLMGWNLVMRSLRVRIWWQRR